MSAEGEKDDEQAEQAESKRMTHQAIVVTATEKAELLTVDGPAVLGPKEVRGKTLYTLVSPGTELAHHYLGLGGKDYPLYPGYSAMFEVEETGQEVENVKKGDHLFCMGLHQSFQQMDAAWTVPLPVGLEPEKALIARLMTVTMTTLITTAARPGDRVMITGAGSVGYLAAQVFKLSGYEVHVVEPNSARRKNAAASGVAAVYPEVPCNDESIVGTISLVMECSGHEQAVVDACRIVRKLGEVVLVGVPWTRHTDLYVQELLRLIFHRYVILRSGWEWELPGHATDFRPHSIFANYRTALKWLKDDRIKVHGLTSLAKPCEAQLVYQNLLHRRDDSLFNIFDWT